MARRSSASSWTILGGVTLSAAAAAISVYRILHKRQPKSLVAFTENQDTTSSNKSADCTTTELLFKQDEDENCSSLQSSTEKADQNPYPVSEKLEKNRRNHDNAPSSLEDPPDDADYDDAIEQDSPLDVDRLDEPNESPIENECIHEAATSDASLKPRETPADVTEVSTRATGDPAEEMKVSIPKQFVVLEAEAEANVREELAEESKVEPLKVAEEIAAKEAATNRSTELEPSAAGSPAEVTPDEVDCEMAKEESCDSPTDEETVFVEEELTALELAILQGDWMAIGEAAELMSDTDGSGSASDLAKLTEIVASEGSRSRTTLSSNGRLTGARCSVEYRPSLLLSVYREDDVIDKEDWRDDDVVESLKYDENWKIGRTKEEQEALAEAETWMQIAAQTKGAAADTAASDAAEWAIGRSLQKITRADGQQIGRAGSGLRQEEI